MQKYPDNSLSYGLVHCSASASLSKGRRRGWPNVRPGIDVNSDQVLNTGKPDKPWMK